MGTTFTSKLLGWSFAPAVTLNDRSGAEGLSPQGLALEFIPASLRRRCSAFSRVTLAVAHAARSARADNVTTPTVFASAHGEGDVTKQLLVDIAKREPMSPMGFSLSVHNAASGLYSIASGNRAPATAIAAGEDTFVMGLCEALMSLHEGNAEQVLYVCSDDVVPSIFLGEGAPAGVPYALALLLGKSGGGEGFTLSCDVEPGEEAAVREGAPPAIAFARWLRGNKEELVVSSSVGLWRFSITGGESKELFVSPMEARV